MKIITLDQRSKEWHNWRNGVDLPDGKPRITATAASVIMGKNPYKTPYRLWMQMTGRAEPDAENWAMRRGSRLEPEAVEAYTAATGNVMQPVCIEHSDFPWAAASLDGLSVFGDRGLEVKCPGKEVFEMAFRGLLPDHYYAQVQWQLYCGGGEIAEIDYWCYDGSKGAGPVVVRSDPFYQSQMFDACKAFRQMLIEDVPPAGSEWLDAARAWRNAKEAADEAKEVLEEVQKRLIQLLPDSSDKEEGGGVVVTRYSAKGGVDNDKVITALSVMLDKLKAEYEKACAQAGINPAGSEAYNIPAVSDVIEQFRKPDSTRFRVSPTADVPLEPVITPSSAPTIGEGGLW